MYFSSGQYARDYHVDMCGHCRLNTGGEHEEHCPLFKPVIARGEIFNSINFYYKFLPDLSINFYKGAELSRRA